MVFTLEVDNISKKYQDTIAVNNISFNLKKSEILGIIGPNGSGKTTAMRIITDLIRNFKGNVYINGSTIKKEKSENKRIGCIIETPGFYPYLSGMDNLKYFAMYSDNIDKKVFDEYIELLGLTSAINKKVSKYSLGMKQRLGILQALLNKPELLILDEPTNGLDPNGIQEFREYIKKLVKEKEISILISSHILSEIELICNRVLVMQNGKILKEIVLDKESQDIQSMYVFNTNDTNTLLDYLKKEEFKINNVGKNHVKLDIGKRNISEVIMKIHEKNIKLTGITQDVDSLETKYFDLTGGNMIE